MSRIISIATAVPAYQYTQQDILKFMLHKMPEESISEKRLLKYIFKKSGIAYRHSVLPDFDPDLGNPLLYSSQSPLIPNVEERMRVFDREAPLLLISAIRECLQGIDYAEVTHIITVSCTGLSAPGLDVEMTQQLGFSDTIYRSSVNFMGCHGGFHALKQAFYICKHQPEANVLIADVELSTIHFQKNTTSDEMLGNTLFADGAAAVLVSGENSRDNSDLTIFDFYSKLTLKGKSAMAWHIGTQGFAMNLSTQVPDLITEDFNALLHSVLKRDLPEYGLENILWAFHPGGIRILEAIAELSKLNKEQMRTSYDILEQYGNMSSCTIFFVLEKLMQKALTTGKPILAMGFGPGLSTEIMIFKVK